MANIEDKARELVNDLNKEYRELNALLQNGKVFTRFVTNNDIIDNQKEIVTSPLFDTLSELTEIYTGSYQTEIQKQYYLDVVKESISLDNEFSIVYGNLHGSGSLDGNPTTLSPSKAIYKQFKQVLLDPGQDVFKFKDNITSDSIYGITFKRERFKQRLDPGNIQINLSELNGLSFSNNTYTGSNIQVSGSNKIISLIDDSNDSADIYNTLTYTGRVYNIVSGSIEDGIYTPDTNSYGLLYPDMGVIILNANLLNSELNFNTVTGSNINGDNVNKLFTSLSGSAGILTGSCIEGRASEVVSSTYYYCRIKNTEYNFSTNPSFTTGSLGDLRHPTMLQNPQVFVTTIGLYNDNQELLAIGKLSKPILKNFSRETNIKVKIDW
jgi:hypothetical protein